MDNAIIGSDFSYENVCRKIKVLSPSKKIQVTDYAIKNPDKFGMSIRRKQIEKNKGVTYDVIIKVVENENGLYIALSTKFKEVKPNDYVNGENAKYYGENAKYFNRPFIQWLIRDESELDRIIKEVISPYFKKLDSTEPLTPENVQDCEELSCNQDDGDDNGSQIDPMVVAIIDRLNLNYNMVLHGAPGTGKTYLARQVAKQILANDLNKDITEITDNEVDGVTGFVQFHPSYDYTDFVEGLRPVPPDERNKASKDVQFERKDGVFKAFCKKAIENPDSNKKYIFIIDEINRGNMSKIFGELFFSIDPGYRGLNGRVSTQYQNLISDDDVFYKGFYVPENVYIIGTMNDIDRSVECMDFAFRRRFVFKEIKAADNRDWLKNVLGDKYDRTISVMDALNRAIYDEKSKDSKDSIKGLDASYHIGAAYFAKLKNMEFNYDKLWDLSLKPLLNEYVRGNRDPRGDLKKLEKAYKAAYNEASKEKSNEKVAGEENSSETTQS